ncbi:DHH family phosphoesterase [Prevotella multiformis]|uniref:DHH family phosphoesterase n=1 Tax=Prevotella multiformis TaxID=282402 RepID=UPI0028DC2AFA|nr:DHH family phosphoesterase [Prevotella multiformis]
MDLNLLSTEETATLRNLLSHATHIVICAHKSPDGDAIGSSLAWMHYLQQIGKTDIKVCMPDATPDFLHWLPGHNCVIRYDRRPKGVEKAFREADLVCCLDFNQNSRVDAMQEVLEHSNALRLLVDHHLEPDTDNALTVSHPEMSSTSEIVFRLISQLGGYGEMTRQCAACIYCGMMTDTGGFTYNSSRPEIFYIIGQLLAKGIDKDEIYNRVFHNYSSNALRLRAHIILNKMKVIEELHASYYTVTKEEMTKFHFIKGDMEGLVNVPQQIKGLKLSISLREDTEKPSLVLVSLRSCNGFHCQPMAARFFNGGGHADASGGKLHCTIEEAEQIVIKAILYYKEELR